MGLTQKALAAFLEISTRQVIRYEKGTSELPGPLAILIDRKIPKIPSLSTDTWRARK